MKQLSMFAAPPKIEWQHFALPDADVSLLHNFVSPEDASRFFLALREDGLWRQDKITVFGREHLLPRLQRWHGDPRLTYTWSGLTMEPEPWTTTLLQLRQWVERRTGASFNAALLNRYRTGDDTVGPHADDEAALGERPTIASLSFGAERDFVLQHVDGQRVTILLPAGSLLLMKGDTQKHWKHSLPRRKGVGERINVTFRRMVA